MTREVTALREVVDAIADNHKVDGLMCLVVSGEGRNVVQLLGVGADPSGMAMSGYWAGCVPLIAVGGLCYRLVITLLLAAGAEIGTHDGMRWTLLRWSVQRDGKTVVKALITSYYGVAYQTM